MQLKRSFLLIILAFIFIKANSQNNIESQQYNSVNDVIVQSYITYLKKYFSDKGTWYSTNPKNVRNIKELIQFINSQPIDTVLKNIEISTINPAVSFVSRLPEQVDDSLMVEGYIPAEKAGKSKQEIEAKIRSAYHNKEVFVPSELFDELEKKVKLVSSGKGMVLFTDSIYTLPDSLEFLDAIPEDMVQTTEDFKHMLELDSLRTQYVEEKRIFYNDSIVKAKRDSLIFSYRNNLVNNEVNEAKKSFTDSVSLNNYQVLKAYNDSVVKAVNDSIAIMLSYLSAYADQIDTTRITISNLTGSSSHLTLGSQSQEYTRIWLKNEQNDSLSVLIRNADKRSLSMLIDDGVTFKRFTQKQNKMPEFAPVTNHSLEKIESRYKIETPWNINGDGNLGFTQTYLENWKKGGKSAISMLMVLKGSANYSRDKVKWENSVEIRNGWIKLGNANSDDTKIQKNDDKFEVTSRFGLSAFKKWYYSTELNFETQFFNGYKYPDRENPISGFLAPAKTLFKIGLDYKPNKNFSLFLSPLTSKTVFVADTIKIDQTNFGIEEGKKRFWEPGLNADLKYKHTFAQNFIYETKYKMFMNYTQPFTKFDINWENSLKMQLTDHINMQFMFHMLYDDNVLFTVFDDDGNAVKNPDGSVKKETRLQLKELITVGFTYKINKKVYRSRKII